MSQHERTGSIVKHCAWTSREYLEWCYLLLSRILCYVLNVDPLLKNCPLHLPVKEVQLNEVNFKILKKVVVLVSCQVSYHIFFYAVLI